MYKRQGIVLRGYKHNDLLNLDPTVVKSKQLIWIANNKKSDWDVLRLTPMDLRLVGLQSINNNTQLTVDFDTSHSLSVEDYVMISNSQYEDLNGVYIVQSIPSPNSIIINYTKNISTLVGVSDKSTANTYGNISQFVSVRMSSIDDVYNNLLFEEFQEEDTDIMAGLSDEEFVSHVPPTADAGMDAVVNATEDGTAIVLLDGSATSPGSQGIEQWIWRDGHSKQIGDTSMVNVRLPIGNHTFTLTDSDPARESSTDTITVQVLGETREDTYDLLND